LTRSWSRGLAVCLGVLVCAGARDGLASTDDVRRALDAAAASIESTNAGRYDEARDILQQVKTIVIAERAAVDALSDEAKGGLKGCVDAVKELDIKIGEIDTTAERVLNDIKTTDDALRTAVSDGDVAASEIAEIERALSGLEDGLRDRQGKLEEIGKWWWVPGYGSYLGIRSLAERDLQEIGNLSREFQEKEILRNGSVERLRKAQATWAKLAAERSLLIAEKSSAAAMRANLDQRMDAARQATAFLADAKQFWADLASFTEFQAKGSVTRASVFATSLAKTMGQPASDALVLGISGQQANMRARLIQLAGQLENGKGYAGLAAASCTPKPGAAPLKACDITPTVPFYKITDFETCSFRYVNPPDCPPAEASHSSAP
jgi:hypothetical protein